MKKLFYLLILLSEMKMEKMFVKLILRKNSQFIPYFAKLSSVENMSYDVNDCDKKLSGALFFTFVDAGLVEFETQYAALSFRRWISLITWWADPDKLPKALVGVATGLSGLYGTYHSSCFLGEKRELIITQRMLSHPPGC